MAHEDHTPRCSNSNGGGGGGRLSKKLKNKRVPQRGMGVAQLEKIISEERHKNDVALLTPNSTNFRPPPPPSIPLPPPLPPNHRRLIPITDAMNPIFVSTPIHTISDGGDNWSRLWSGSDHNNPNQNRGLDHRPYAAIWRPISTTTTQRSQLFQQQCSSSMASSSSSSSVMNFQMELPSNQSYCSNNYHWPHEEKMIGMKKPYPFSVENIPIPSFNFKFPNSSISRSNELASSTSFELPTPVSREKNNSNLIAKDFLTLGPSRSSSNEKFAPLSVGERTLPLHQGQTKDPSGSEWSNRLPLYSFFPASKTTGNNGEQEEHVDLNLKL